jgi:anti-sigma factor RsiW
VIHEPIRCIEMVEVITEWMEGALSDASRAEVEEHLAICPDCVAYLDQLRAATALAARLADAGAVAGPAPEALKARLLAAFHTSRPSADGPDDPSCS